MGHLHLPFIVINVNTYSLYIQRDPVKFEIQRKLHLLAQHELNGTITGLSALRTIESSVDGLDRLLVSFEHAKVSRI